VTGTKAGSMRALAAVLLSTVVLLAAVLGLAAPEQVASGAGRAVEGMAEVHVEVKDVSMEGGRLVLKVFALDAMTADAAATIVTTKEFQVPPGGGRLLSWR